MPETHHEPDADVDVATSLDAVRDQIAAAARAAGRAPEDVVLVAVGKLQPVERVRAALVAGHRVFGENGCRRPPASGPPSEGNSPMCGST